MKSKRYTPKSVKGYIYSGVEYIGIGIFDNQTCQFIDMNDNKPYCPAGGWKTAKEVAELANNGELIGDVVTIAHDK